MAQDHARVTRLARLIHPIWEKKRWMWRKAAIRFMVLFTRPNHGSIEERHTHHEPRYSPSLRSSIGCTQEIERRVRRWTAVVECGCACAARRREEARACYAPCSVHPRPTQARTHRTPA